MAARFWVGGAGNFSDTAHWSATTGGAGGQTVPIAGDTVTFDTLSGVGTVTWDQAVNVVSVTGSASSVDFDLSASVITLTGTGTVWSFPAQRELAGGTSSITASGAGAVFNGGSRTYFDVSFTGSGIVNIDGGNSYHNLSRIGTASKFDEISLPQNGLVLTVTNLLTITGNSATNRMYVKGGSGGATGTFSCANAPVLTNCDFEDINFIGAAAPVSGTSLVNRGNNTGITFTAPVTRFWVGNGGNYSDTAHWSASDGGASGASVPLVQDTALFTANSITLAAQTINFDMPAVPGADFSSVLNTPTVNIANAGTASERMYGSLDLTGVGTFNATNPFVGSARSGTHTIDLAGKDPKNNITITASGGTYVLTSAITYVVFGANSGVTIADGTFDTGGFAITSSSFVASTSRVKRLILGASIITLKRPNVGSINISASNTTIDPNTAVFKLDTAGTTTQTITMTPITNANGTSVQPDMNGATLQIVNLGTATLTFNGQGIWNHFIFPAGVTTTIVPVATGSTFKSVAGRVGTLKSSTPGSAATLSRASGTVLLNHLTISDITAAGGATWDAHDSVDVSGNTGITFKKAKKLAMAGVGV